MFLQNGILMRQLKQIQQRKQQVSSPTPSNIASRCMLLRLRFYHETTMQLRKRVVPRHNNSKYKPQIAIFIILL